MNFIRQKTYEGLSSVSAFFYNKQAVSFKVGFKSDENTIGTSDNVLKKNCNKEGCKKKYRLDLNLRTPAHVVTGIALTTLGFMFFGLGVIGITIFVASACFATMGPNLDRVAKGFQDLANFVKGNAHS